MLNLGSHRLLKIIFFFLLFPPCLVYAQNKTDSSSTITVIPGKQFDRSGWHNIFWGRHYRREWSTPVAINKFYIDTAFGGLKPSQEGGGRQTKSLRLKNEKGKEYVMRSVEKDYSKALPEIYHGTFIDHIAKDQTSTGYPFAAVSITPMIEAAGVYHTNPKIIFLPSQPALGEFDKEFANKVYLIEERPDENQEDAGNFGNAKNVIGSEKLFEKVYGDNDHHMDQKAFARARLFDMLIGDWGRHPDNWRWAEFKDDKKTIYRPIPRDRDQAYTIFDGFWPWIATNVSGAIWLESFDYKIHNPKRMNRPGLVLDRQFANELSEKDWIDIAKDLQQRITDSVIEYSIHQLPPEVFAISGQTLINKLKSRRDHLAKYASEYYNFLSHHVELVGSDDKELFEINRLNEKQTQVNIYKITKENQQKKDPYYSRTFTSDETNEIRLYSLGKSDFIKINGDQDQGVKIRVIDPETTDSFNVKPSGRTKLSVGDKFHFDTTRTKKSDFFILPILTPAEYKIFENDPLEFVTKTRMKVSANLRYNEQPWRKSEYQHQHLFTAMYGISRNVFNVGYVGRFGRTVGKWDLLLKARLDIPGAENFYGVGNETEILDHGLNAYKVTSNRFIGGVGLDRLIGKYQRAYISLLYQSVKLQDGTSKNISAISLLDPALFDVNRFAGAEALYGFRKINDPVVPTKGFDFNIGAAWMQNLTRTDQQFAKFVSAASIYLPLGKMFSIAVRGGGAAVTGDADYYHMARIGGFVNLRGYERERFYGKTSFYNNNELRWFIPTKNYFFNGKIGLMTFYDQGRVWQPLEVSNKWHSGYGGGLILVPFNLVALTATYGVSEEAKILQLKVGMFF